jgi:hypothetical protein
MTHKLLIQHPETEINNLQPVSGNR